jgi:hypothetical protein
MKWLKRKINRWLNYDSSPIVDVAVPNRTIGANSVDIEGLSFNVMPATGGTVVQIRHYDRKTDRHNNITHVIPDGEDIAERIGQIVSLELLRA